MGRVQSVGKLSEEGDMSVERKCRGTRHHVRKVEKSLGIITEEKAQKLLSA
jgi:hypothetical protein